MDSVWSQSYRPIELIIIDDGSTDNTSQIVAEWSQSHKSNPHFSIYYFKQVNRGASAARNFGLEKSNGEFIQFLDSDDLLHPEKVARQVKYSLEYGVSVYGDCQRFAADSRGILLFPVLIRICPETALRDWFEGRFVLPSSFLWRRVDILQNGPWNEKLSFDDDGEFACRFLLNGGKWEFCPDSWVYYRIYLDLHAQQVSRVATANALMSKFDALKATEKKLTELGLLNSLRASFSYCYWNLAKQAGSQR